MQSHLIKHKLLTIHDIRLNILIVCNSGMSFTRCLNVWRTHSYVETICDFPFWWGYSVLKRLFHGSCLQSANYM